jgi:hypothetical protein
VDKVTDNFLMVVLTFAQLECLALSGVHHGDSHGDLKCMMAGPPLFGTLDPKIHHPYSTLTARMGSYRNEAV